MLSSTKVFKTSISSSRLGSRKLALSLLSVRGQLKTEINFKCSGAMSDSVKCLQGIKQLSGKYKAALLDQFGVLHDGKKPYPNAIEAVSKLNENGIKSFIISNSSKRSEGTINKLVEMGFEPSCFAGAVTSGELTHEFLSRRPSEWWRRLGNRCLHITWSKRSQISIDGLGLEVVTRPEDADFILCHGTEGLAVPAHGGRGGHVQEMGVEQIRELLACCAALPAPPPLICANPDLVTVQGTELAMMPGALANMYSEHGVRCAVQLMGKPEPLIYDACLAALGLERHQVVAIGDSVEHDVQGGRGAGLDVVFVAGGIHAGALLPSMEDDRWAAGVRPHRVNMEGLARLCEGRARPQYVVPFLEW